jgi:alkylated DNA repair protein alkB family protein 6
MLEEPVPRFIHQIFGLLVETGIFPEAEPPNHVLINSYKCGQGIAPHQDGPLYEPLVAILSLDGPALLQFWPPRVDEDGVALAPDLNASSTCSLPSASILCEPNSLVVFRGQAYKTHWHGILSRDDDVLADHTRNLDALSGGLLGATAGTRVQRKDRRVSLTVRRVLKVLSEDSRVFTQDAVAEQKRKDKWWLASRGEEGLKQGFI